MSGNASTAALPETPTHLPRTDRTSAGNLPIKCVYTVDASVLRAEGVGGYTPECLKNLYVPMMPNKEARHPCRSLDVRLPNLRRIKRESRVNILARTIEEWGSPPASQSFSVTSLFQEDRLVLVTIAEITEPESFWNSFDDKTSAGRRFEF